MTFSAEQLRAARGYLDWTRLECGTICKVSPETIKNIEIKRFNPRAEIVEAIVKTIRAHGVEFTEYGIQPVKKCPKCGSIR